MYIGELINQTLTVKNGDAIFANITWQMEKNLDNVTAVKIGPLHRNTTYTTTVTLITELPYLEDDGSEGVFRHISETCYGKSFMSTEWECADGVGSVPWSEVCDNPFAPNCADGSDEAKHLCTGGGSDFVVVSLVVYFFAGIITISFGKYQVLAIRCLRQLLRGLRR